MGVKVGLRCKSKTLLGLVDKLFVFTSVDWKQNMIAKNKNKTKFCLFHVVCKISNFKMWTTKYLVQAFCTELTLPISVIGPNRGKIYQCAVCERENWCPFVWWCHENDVPRLGSWRLSSFDLLGRADQPTTAIPHAIHAQTTQMAS